MTDAERESHAAARERLDERTSQAQEAARAAEAAAVQAKYLRDCATAARR